MQPRPVNCFLIDDDTDDQEIFLMAIEQLGRDIRCQIAGSAAEGLHHLTANPSFVPDHIFLDVNMPRMNGFQCLAELRKLDRLKNTKVIMFSTSADARAIETSKSLGADDYIVKPPSVSLLADRIIHLLSEDE